jgi:hypothetical protein
MLLTPFCVCLVLLLITILFDLRTSLLLRRGMQTRGTKAVRALWPLHVFIHVVLLYVVASAPLLHTGTVTEIHTSSRLVPGPFVPSIPPYSSNWKRNRIEHL